MTELASNSLTSNVLQRETRGIAKPMAKHSGSFRVDNRMLASLIQKRMNS